MNENLYDAILKKITRDIATGALAPGQKLPSERRLAETHGVSLITIRRVSQELSRSGLIYSLTGKGSFVKEAPGAPRATGGKNIVYLTDYLGDFYDLQVFANLEGFFSPKQYNLVLKEGRFDLDVHRDRALHLDPATTAALVVRVWFRDYETVAKILRRFSFPVLFISHPIHGDHFHYVHPSDERTVANLLRALGPVLPPATAVVAPGSGLLETDRVLAAGLCRVKPEAQVISMGEGREGGGMALADEIKTSWAARENPESLSRNLVGDFLKKNPLPEFFLCANEYAATGTYLALQDGGIQVPGQTSVVGITDGGRYFHKLTGRSLAGFDKQTAFLGKVAAQQLLLAMEDPQARALRTEVPAFPVSGDTAAAPYVAALMTPPPEPPL